MDRMTGDLDRRPWIASRFHGSTTNRFPQRSGWNSDSFWMITKAMGSNPTASILVIGDEILSGRTQDTNTNYIAKFLGSLESI